MTWLMRETNSSSTSADCSRESTLSTGDREGPDSRRPDIVDCVAAPVADWLVCKDGGGELGESEVSAHACKKTGRLLGAVS